MRTPTIDVFAITYNEEFLLPYFLDHYDFARQIFVLDNESTDRTVEIADAHPKVKVISWSSQGLQNNLTMRYVKNECWKGSDADYVVVCDVDEFIDCSPLNQVQYDRDKPYAFKCEGRQMVGVDGQDLRDIDLWYHSVGYDKIAVFNPVIHSINYGCGAHDAAPTCPVTQGLLILRHYCMLGEEYVVKRYQRYAARMSQMDKDNNWGWQYLQEEDKIRQQYRNDLQLAKGNGLVGIEHLWKKD